VALDKNAVLDNAQKYTAQGKFADAITEWKKLADVSPADGTPYNAIGDLHLKKNANSDAIEAYFKAAAAFRTGGVALKAIAVLKKILKLDPNQYLAYKFLADLNAERGLASNAVADYLSLSKLYLKANKAKEALDSLQSVVKLEPANLEARRQIADLCLKQNWAEEGGRAFVELGRVCVTQNRLDEAKEAFKQAKQLDPKNRDAEQHLQELSTGQTGAFTALTPGAGAAGQVNPAALDKATKPALLEYAVAQMNSGQYGPAEAALSELLSREPGESEVCRLLARVHLKAGQIVVARGEIQFFAETAIRSGDYKLAESMVQEFLEVNPTSVTMLELLGKVHEAGGDMATAATHYGRAVEVLLEHPDPDNPTLPIEIFEKIKEIASTSPVVAKLTALFQAGQAAPAAAPAPAPAAVPVAEAPAAPAQEQHSEQDLLIRYELGVAYRDMGLLEEAMEELEVALKGPTCFVNASHAMGLCLKTKGKTRDAIGYLEQAVANPGCVGDLATIVRYDLGLLYESDGQMEKASQVFSQIPLYKDVPSRLNGKKTAVG
jgi:tetratricopeptide (TPR) repeat protein